MTYTASPVINETWYTGGFLVSEMPGTGSRDVVNFDNSSGGLDLLVQAGAVYSYEGYGVVTAAAASGNTGNGTVSGAIAYPATATTRAALLGAYVVTFTSATAFGVVAPDGTALGTGTTGTNFVSEIGFKITAGGTAFVAGDSFTLTVAAGYGFATTAAKSGGNTGNGTMGTVTLAQPSGANPGALTGTYRVIFTAATTFTVYAPDGRELLPGTTGAAYSDEIGFTITAGGTAFVAGDEFDVTVADVTSIGLPTLPVTAGAALGNVVAYTGAAPAAGIVYNRAYVPAYGTKKVTAITRNAEVNAAELQWASGVTAAQQAAALVALRAFGIVAR